MFAVNVYMNIIYIYSDMHIPLYVYVSISYHKWAGCSYNYAHYCKIINEKKNDIIIIINNNNI